MTFDEIVAKFPDARRHGDGKAVALCPIHEADGAHHDPSLSFSRGAEGKTLLRCQGGCDSERVLAAKGLSMCDLFESKTAKPSGQWIYRDYRDETGKVLFQSVRIPCPPPKRKTFRQRRPDPAGQNGWVWDLKGTRLVLYCLPELLAADPSSTVYICEGEKDVDRLRSMGLTATTNPMGAGKWHLGKEYGEFLCGRHVVVLVDNDPPGKTHAEQVAKSLQGVAASVKVVLLPGLPVKGDVSDWLAAGHNVEELQAIVEVAPEWKPQTEPERVDEPDSESSDGPVDDGEPEHLDNSDADHAARLWRDLKGSCHYVLQWRAFAFYDSKRGVWEQDIGGGKVLAATEKITAQLLAEAQWYARAASECADKKRADKYKARLKDLQEEALQSKSLRRKKAAIELLRAQPGCEVSSAIFDVQRGLLNFLNGTCDLDKDEFREHRRGDFLTVVLPYNFDPTAKCPLFEKFHEELWPGDLETQRFMQRWDGYGLSGYTTEQVFVYAYGEGRNGKGVRTRIMQLVRGDYATTSPIEMLLAEKHGEKFKGLIDLKGKRHTTCSEVPEGKALNTTLIKLATGEDTMTDAAKYQRLETWNPTHKIEIVGNHLLRLPETGDAIQRRLLMVGYEQSFHGARCDRNLFSKLKAEVPGIMNWCIEGFREWKRLGELGAPRKVLDDSAAYIAENDTIGPFFEIAASIVGTGLVDRKTLYSAYLKWSNEQGFTHQLGPQAFAGKAREHGLKEGPKRQGERTWNIPGAPGQPGAPVLELFPREAIHRKTSEIGAPRCPAAPDPRIDGDDGFEEGTI